MKVEIVKVGYLKCNCYILSIYNEVLIIDPGDEFHKIDRIINGRKVCGIIVTHHHFDHDGAVDDLLKKYDINVYDINNLSESSHKIGPFIFDIIYTPGHKDDLITIYFKKEEMMFCGDFIFKGGIGRCDLPGGNMYDMEDSIMKIKKYSLETVIYPGHGDKTKLQDENL